MKKLLSILASISIAASSSAGVVACGTQTQKNNKVTNANSYVNNNLGDILNASLEKAKTVIFDNEFGINQDASQQVMSGRTLSQDGLSFSKDSGFTGNDKASALINRYFGRANASNEGHESNVSLGGVDGSTSGLSYLVSEALDAVVKSPMIKNFVLRNLDNAIKWLGTTTDLVNAQTIETVNQTAYSLGIGDKWLPNVVLSTIVTNVNKIAGTSYGKIIVKIIDGILSGRVKFEGLLDSVFKNKYVDIARAVLAGAFKDNALNKAVYGEAPLVLPNLDGEKTSDDPSITIQAGSSSETPKTELDDTPSNNADAGTITYTTEGTKIPDIKTTDIKDELGQAIDDILNTLFVLPKFTKDQQALLDKDAAFTINGKPSKLLFDVSMLITGLMSGNKLKINSLTQGRIMKIAVQGIRVLTIINAWFSMFEDSHISNITSSANLFGSMSNYEYLNNKKINDKYLWQDATLADTPYLTKVENDTTTDPLNLNYMISNLNYFFGSLDDESGQGAYRVQQLLFLIMNDPSSEPDSTTGENKPSTSKSWNYKNSSILDFIIKLGINAVYQMMAPKTDSTSQMITGVIDKILGDGSDYDSTVETLEDLLVKPVLLGMLNGDSFKDLYEALVSGLQAALTSIPALQSIVAPFQDKIDEIMNSLKRLISNPEFANDTLHSLFIVDFRPILNGLSIIPQNFLDKFFGMNMPINLTTLLSMPLNKVFTLLNVPGFEGGKISPIGDFYTTQTIPKLLNTLDNIFNFIGSQGNTGATKYVAMKADPTDPTKKVVDWAHSLKARDLDLSALYGLFISIVGTGGKSTSTDPTKDTSENIFTRLLNVIQVDPDELANDMKADPEIVPDIKIVPSKLLSVIGANAPGGPAQSFADKPSDGGGGDTPAPTVPITYSQYGFTWSLYKMVLPLVDHTAPDQDSANGFKMNPDYLGIDLLNDSYTKAITVLDNMNNAPYANYSVMLNQILNYNNSFTFSYDKKDIGYFADNRDLIRSLKFVVVFKNPMSGKTNTYTFRVSRNSNITGFDIDSITSDKDD